MNILEKNKELFGQRVRVTCTDGATILGLWSEWWDEEDNSYLEDDGLPVCDSILVDSEDAPIEILITDIKAIQKAL